MLAYRHLFHAGNFADVHKHALLARLVARMRRKPNAFRYIDTHAGIGRYDLTHEWARKNAEFADGIARVWEVSDAPAPLNAYLGLVRKLNAGGRLRFYPGSPALVQALLRAHDRAVLSELNAKDCVVLTECFAQDRRITVIHQDGYQTLRSHLPPPERRGLVLVDSSFDRSGEYERLALALREAHRRFATGVFALWYPLMGAAAVAAFERKLVASGIRKMLVCSLEVYPPSWTASLRGCALVIVNPPFGFEAEARTISTWLAPRLARQGEGRTRVDWLVPE